MYFPEIFLRFELTHVIFLFNVAMKATIIFYVCGFFLNLSYLSYGNSNIILSVCVNFKY